VGLLAAEQRVWLLCQSAVVRWLLLLLLGLGAAAACDLACALLACCCVLRRRPQQRSWLLLKLVAAAGSAVACLMSSECHLQHRSVVLSAPCCCPLHSQQQQQPLGQAEVACLSASPLLLYYWQTLQRPWHSAACAAYWGQSRQAASQYSSAALHAHHHAEAQHRSQYPCPLAASAA
jgi:hypothetical protein